MLLVVFFLIAVLSPFAIHGWQNWAERRALRSAAEKVETETRDVRGGVWVLSENAE